MRREFLKSDFQNAAMEKPVEFEIKDYDEALKTSKYPQIPVKTPIPTPATAPAETPQVPDIKQEPVEEPTTPIAQEVNQPAVQKLPASIKRLQSNLDGKAWECTDTHRPHLRVKTTGIEEEEEYLESWDNTIPAEEYKQPKKE